MKRSIHPVGLIFLGLFATPVAVAWMIDRERLRIADPGHRFRLFPWISLLCAALFLTLTIIPIKWSYAAWIWSGTVLFISIILALTAYMRNPDEDKAEPNKGWAIQTLAAVPFVLFPAFAVGIFCMIVTNTLMNRFFVRFPIFAASPDDVAMMMVDSVWTALWCLFFIGLSLRRGFLRNDSEMGVALAAWLYVLILKSVLADRLLKILGSLAIGIQTDLAFSDFMRVVLIFAFSLALPFLAAYLAWNPGRTLRKHVLVTAICLLASLSGCMSLGVISWVECAAGKSIERSGEPFRALKWYGRSLIRRSNPELVTYLQYRIGLLSYKSGQVDRAIASFRMIQTMNNDTPDLVVAAGNHLNRLLEHAAGDRVVLPGVETQTEFCPSYCAPNTLSLIFHYWDIEKRATEIGSEIATYLRGSEITDIVEYCNRQGFRHIMVPFMNDSDIRTILAAGIPVTAYIPGHVLAIFGFDERLRTYVVYDTASWDIWEDHPADDFMMQWSRTNYTGAIIAPVDASPEIVAVCRRYETPASKAAWYGTLAVSTDNYWATRAYWKAAFRADPMYFPAYCALARDNPSYDESFQSVSIEQDIARVQELYRRDHFCNWLSIIEFMVFLFQQQHYTDLIDIARDIRSLNVEPVDPEDKRHLQDIQNLAGIASYSIGDSLTAFRLIDPEYRSFSGLSALVSAKAQIASGQPEKAISSLDIAIRFGSGDIAREAIEQLEKLDWAIDSGAIIEGFEVYLRRWPLDVRRQIRFAEMCLDIENRGGKSQEGRMVQARVALLTARALAKHDPLLQSVIASLENRLNTETDSL